MLYSNEWLKKCSELKDLFPFEQGDRVARGFADLGYEEYVYLPNEKLLSLYTASVAKLHPAHLHHFFKVLETEDLSKYLINSNLNFIITYDDQFICKVNQEVFYGSTIDEVLMKAVYEFKIR